MKHFATIAAIMFCGVSNAQQQSGIVFGATPGAFRCQLEVDGSTVIETEASDGEAVESVSLTLGRAYSTFEHDRKLQWRYADETNWRPVRQARRAPGAHRSHQDRDLFYVFPGMNVMPYSQRRRTSTLWSEE